MTNDQMDVLLRRLDEAASPDPAFVTASAVELTRRVHAARARDLGLLGRLERSLHASLAPDDRQAILRPVGILAVVVLLVLALVAGLVLVGSTNRPGPLGNGLVVVSRGGQLQAIDPVTGATRQLVPAAAVAGVSRSPDGATATYWTTVGSQSRLFAVGVDGAGLRELTPAARLTWAGSVDTWSPDSRILATEVRTEPLSRIWLIDVVTGVARPVTPPDVHAHDPLWSPDGRWIAFRKELTTGSAIAVIRPDGSGMHEVSGYIHGLAAAGPDTWSPDGWIYFGATGPSTSHDFRANAAGAFSQQITGDGVAAYAVASSPDGSRIAFIVSAVYGFDTWIADSNGAHARPLLAAAGIASWSTDGQQLLVVWKPVDPAKGGLATINADGTGLTVLVPFDASCRKGWDQTCLSGFGWGPPRT